MKVLEAQDAAGPGAVCPGRFGGEIGEEAVELSGGQQPSPWLCSKVLVITAEDSDDAAPTSRRTTSQQGGAPLR